MVWLASMSNINIGNSCSGGGTNGGVRYLAMLYSCVCGGTEFKILMPMVLET